MRITADPSWVVNSASDQDLGLDGPSRAVVGSLRSGDRERHASAMAIITPLCHTAEVHEGRFCAAFRIRYSHQFE